MTRPNLARSEYAPAVVPFAKIKLAAVLTQIDADMADAVAEYVERRKGIDLPCDCEWPVEGDAA